MKKVKLTTPSGAEPFHTPHIRHVGSREPATRPSGDVDTKPKIVDGVIGDQKG